MIILDVRVGATSKTPQVDSPGVEPLLRRPPDVPTMKTESSSSLSSHQPAFYFYFKTQSLEYLITVLACQKGKYDVVELIYPFFLLLKIGLEGIENL